MSVFLQLLLQQIFQLLFLTTQVHAEILRLQCAIYANFTAIEPGRKLPSTFSTIEGIGKSECQYECSLDERCKSINIDEAELICQLNNRSSEDPNDNAITVASNRSWTYYSTRYDESLVGRKCIEENPCPRGWKCYDTCNCPGYRCTAKRCQDWYYSGARKNGNYNILNNHGSESYPVYCDFESEVGSVWTLVMSYSYQNLIQFKDGFSRDRPSSPTVPNWNSYRLGKPMMEHIRSLSTLWRATCSFPKYNVDYRDYLRASFHHLDVMTFSGYAACRTVQYIDIRGTNGTNITAPFWQNDEFSLHTDSQFAKCGFTTPDAVHSEDNFGHYVIANPKFRCTETIRSTTQYWFGGNV